MGKMVLDRARGEGGAAGARRHWNENDDGDIGHDDDDDDDGGGDDDDDWDGEEGCTDML